MTRQGLLGGPGWGWPERPPTSLDKLLGGIPPTAADGAAVERRGPTSSYGNCDCPSCTWRELAREAFIREVTGEGAMLNWCPPASRPTRDSSRYRAWLRARVFGLAPTRQPEDVRFEDGRFE